MFGDLRLDWIMDKPERKTLTASGKMIETLAKSARPAPVQSRTSELFRSTRVGEVYWCDFIGFPHSMIPEFDDKHLVVIIRGGKKERDIHVVQPLTSSDQSANPHSYRLQNNPNPGSADVSWAVCNHLYSVASERLQRLRDANGQPRTPEKLADADLRAISEKTRMALMSFLTLGVPSAPERVPGAFGKRTQDHDSTST